MNLRAIEEVALVACSRIKLDHPAPARELYRSPLFRAAKAHVEERYGPNRWLILSAQYGLLEPDQVIEPYDLALREFGRVQRQVWGERVASALAVRFSSTTPLCFFAGALYRHAVSQFVQSASRAPLAGLRVGEQLAWYRHNRISQF